MTGNCIVSHKSFREDRVAALSDPTVVSFQIPFFSQTDQRIESHRHDTEQEDRHQQPIHFEDLTGVDDQVAESVSGGEKFSDDDTDQTQTDVDFHVADDRRNGTRQYDFCQRMAFGAVERVDQFDLFRVDSLEFRIQVQYASENRNGHSGNDDRFGVGSEPDDQKRGECRFRETV